VLLTALWLAAGVSVDGWRLIMALGLAIYTVPSGADIEGALGRQTPQRETDERTHQHNRESSIVQKQR